MDWQDLIEKRQHYFIFEDKEVDPVTIKDAIKEAYEHTFTKNLKYPFKCYLLKNDKIDITTKLLHAAHRNDDWPKERDYGNPQLMAPYLIGFSERNVYLQEIKRQKHYGRTPDGLKLMNYFEAGIFSAYVALALVNRGLDTAYCQNIRHNKEQVQEIFQAQGEIFFVMSVGYGKEPGGNYRWLDSRVNIEKNVPYAGKTSEEYYGRPDFNRIFKEVNG
jgi:nitroreductase